MTEEEFRSRVSRALEASAEAKAEIAKHEAVCGERYERIDETLRSINGNIRTLHARWWQAAAFLITLLLGVAGYLIVNNGL